MKKKIINITWNNIINKFYLGIKATALVEELNMKFGNNVVLLCYEKNKEFCHRQLVAIWLERELGSSVPEIAITEDMRIQILERDTKLINDFNVMIDKMVHENKHNKEYCI